MDAQQSEQTESQAWADVLRHKQRQRQQRAAEKADAAWSQLRSDEALLEEQGAGINPKTEYNIRAVQRKWLAFVATFGDRLAFVEADGPHLQHVRNSTGCDYRTES